MSDTQSAIGGMLPAEIIESIESSLRSVFLGCHRIDPSHQSHNSSPIFWDGRSNSVDVFIEPKIGGANHQKITWRGSFKLAVQPSLADLEFACRLAVLHCFDIGKSIDSNGVIDLDLWALLRASFWLRAVSGRCEFKGKSSTKYCLDTMLRSAQLTYEGRRPRHAVIITANDRFTHAQSSNWFIRFKAPIPMEEALIEEKWVRALVDGQRSILVAKADEKGAVYGIVSLQELPNDNELVHFLYGEEPNDYIYEMANSHLDDIYDQPAMIIESSPSRAHFDLSDDGLEQLYAPHLELLPTIKLLSPFSAAMIISDSGDVFVVLYGGSVFRYSQGAWTYLHYPTIHRLIESVMGEVLTRDLLRLILDLCFKHTGSLLVVVENPSSEVLDCLAPDFSHPRRPNRGLRDALRGQSICVWGVRQLVASAAAVDGAVILDKTGQVLDVACMIGPASERLVHEDDAVPPGSRSQAAKRASMFGLAFKISSDGQMTCYRNGNVFFVV
ncbi:hypothetical protein F0U59_42440 [Archangium gephyra]|nr:hypothetical protein F0U59_42440 [Archangium gephyra]